MIGHMKNSGNMLPLLIALMMACGNPAERTGEEDRQKTYRPVPAFNADSAYAYIQQQVDFGPRVPNTEPHNQTRDWIIAKLESFGLAVQTQEFTETAYDGKVLQLTNIIASYQPEKKKTVLLAAHWDTRRVADKDSERRDEPIDGANDGGSGVAVLLEIARAISSGEEALDVGVDFIFFDGEDDGIPQDSQHNSDNTNWWCLGSQHWAETPHEPGYSAFYGILVDMVGARGARFFQEGVSLQYAAGIVDKVWKNGHHLGYSDFFQMRKSHAITDDHIPVNEVANIPMINIIDYSPDRGFGHYHHTHSDNMDIIDKHTLKVVGETVLFTIYQE